MGSLHRTVSATAPPKAAFIVADGRRWRTSDPHIPANLRQELVNELMAARRAVRDAKNQLEIRRHRAVIETSMQQIHDGAEALAANGPSRAPAPRFAPAGQNTQVIVGAGGESDRDILTKSLQLYARYVARSPDARQDE